MTWQPGRDRVTALLAAGELDQVTPDDEVARCLLEDAGRHLATASGATHTGDLAGAYQLAYDAFRKSAASDFTTATRHPLLPAPSLRN
jgi:hypothetical protein